MLSAAKVTRDSFNTLFDNLVDIVGSSIPRVQIEDIRERWWRWCQVQSGDLIADSFASLTARISADGGIQRFPGIADLRREFEVIASRNAREREAQRLKELEVESRCRLCGGSGVVQLVDFREACVSIDEYSTMKGSDGQYVSGGSLREMSCSCNAGGYRKDLPVFSSGVISSGHKQPGEVKLRRSGARSGLSVKAFEISRRMAAAGMTRADISAEIIRVSTN